MCFYYEIKSKLFSESCLDGYNMLLTAAAELPSEVYELVHIHCLELGIEYKPVTAACLRMELKAKQTLCCVSLILDLGKYVALEDEMGESKWPEWCVIRVAFDLSSNAHCLKLGSAFLHDCLKSRLIGFTDIIPIRVVKLHASSSIVKAWNLCCGTITTATAWVIKYSCGSLETQGHESVVTRKLNYHFCSARLSCPADEQSILAEGGSP